MASKFWDAFSTAFAPSFNAAQDRRLRKKQIEVSEELKEIEKRNEARQDAMHQALYNNKLQQLKREADVRFKSSGIRRTIGSKADVYEKYNRFKDLSSNEQIAYGATIANTAVATNAWRAQQQEVNVYKAMLAQQASQMKTMQYIQQLRNDATNSMMANAQTAEGKVLANRYGELEIQAVTTDDLERKASIREQQKVVAKDIDTANAIQAETDLTNAAILKQGNYDQAFINKLPGPLQTEVYRHYDGADDPSTKGTLLDIRFLSQGWFPGGKEGTIFSRKWKTQPYSLNTAADEGFTMKDWRKGEKASEIARKRKEQIEKTQKDTSKTGVDTSKYEVIR